MYINIYIYIYIYIHTFNIYIYDVYIICNIYIIYTLNKTYIDL